MLTAKMVKEAASAYGADLCGIGSSKKSDVFFRERSKRET